MNQEESFSVECCSWDLSMGMATNPIGRLFLRGTSSSSSAMPEAIDHVGIIVYSRLYEYGHNGIVKSSIPRGGEDPQPQYPGCKLRKREFLGNTTRPRHAFVEWLVNVKYGKFRGHQYDMINHNCLDFATAVCEFLYVPPSPNWEKVSNWARNNQRLADVLTRGFRTPRLLRENGRSASLQESTSSTNENNNTVEALEAVTPPVYSSVVQQTSRNSPMRRRFSVASIMHRSSGNGGMRSASMETLPPTYEEALTMTGRRDSAPKYEDLIQE